MKKFLTYLFNLFLIEKPPSNTITYFYIKGVEPVQLFGSQEQAADYAASCGHQNPVILPTTLTIRR